MHITRIFTGADGQSHFEDLDIPLEPGRYGSISAFVPATGIAFRQTEHGAVLDFHHAPQRQFVVTLEGIAEVECGDGTKRRFAAGDILLADDLDGQGHITREIEGPRRSLFIPLGEGADLAAWRV